MKINLFCTRKKKKKIFLQEKNIPGGKKIKIYQVGVQTNIESTISKTTNQTGMLDKKSTKLKSFGVFDSFWPLN